VLGPQDDDLIGDRLQTQDSIANDLSLSPRQKVVMKLTRYISKCYQRSDACPQSTIDFYRIGKVLGKGAFGKVNLALHQLTKRMVAIKSINKSYFNEEA
jgi:serine/threonine protein kinase